MEVEDGRFVWVWVYEGVVGVGKEGWVVYLLVVVVVFEYGVGLGEVKLAVV